jgi:hypothetical protein
MCKSCSKTNQSEFGAELALHFPGFKCLDKPIVWMFPKVRVCLECGSAFAVLKVNCGAQRRRDSGSRLACFFSRMDIAFGNP